ncbi:zf-C2HC5-domain-containing protein [Linderina pennispora]|uniref:Zf-C2HC5-domain-containing protein n=1 Tax=Linderina pennispora TaxID=61395 RepID=A0A1Y1W9M8_9FUNG|nr:zf-C2HC5-domain-containing protein [Linderina pennispora]ORX70247.1 zf-C2HC5-domain-containing protein [Linderina pennispora]
MIIGATEGDARPLAEFLAGLASPAELQGQLLDMLGESPLALDFAFDLIAKRFPAEDKAPPGEPEPAPLVNYAQATAGTNTPEPDLPPAAGMEPEQKSRRQLKRERQEQERQRKAEEERKQKLANRKRTKCECQASEHALFTNCLSCGHIICELEGPGPCMFCGNDVESPDQQLQQHMKMLLRRAQGADEDSGNSPKSAPKLPSRGMLYSMKAGGGIGTHEAEMLWDTETKKPAAASASMAQTPIAGGQTLTEEEYLAAAFEALGINASAADPVAQRQAESWVKAMRRKERLLEYDRTAAQRSRLIDQSSDFDPFAVGRWMSPQEKIEAEKQAQARLEAQQERESRLRRGMRVLHLNFGDNTVTLANEDHGMDPLDKPPVQAPAPSVSKPREAKTGGSFAHNPLLQGAAEPRFVLAFAGQAASKKGRRGVKPQAKVPEPLSAAQQMERRKQSMRIQNDVTDEIY